MTELITAAEARKIAKPAYDIALEAQKAAVAEAIKQAANGGLTAMVVRVGSDFAHAIENMLRASGYEAHAKIGDQKFEHPEVTFLTVSW